MNDFVEKCNKLTNLIENCTKNDIVVAFSGGVDSSLLLEIACKYAKNNNSKVYAVTFCSDMHSDKEMDFTYEIAKKTGAIHKIIQADVLNEAGIINNPPDRCYKCKKYMFTKICDYAKSVNAGCVIEGTNFDDLSCYRPGIRALKELNILSPLADAKMTKEDVRNMAKEYNIASSNKPSTPCFATRFEYGTALNREDILKVEKAEEYIKSFGFYNVRVRVHGEISRIEVDSTDIPKLVNLRDEITTHLKNIGYKYVTVDLNGFKSGSMDKRIMQNSDI